MWRILVTQVRELREVVDNSDQSLLQDIDEPPSTTNHGSTTTVGLYFGAHIQLLFYRHAVTR